jgi:hypothetical protein
MTAIKVSFFPSLIIKSLLATPQTNLDPHIVEVISKYAQTILHAQIPGRPFTWHYTLPQLPNITLPPDLDDTACALHALLLSRAIKPTRELSEHIESIIRSAEISPSGPYKTWLHDPSAHPVSHPDGVDPVVNSNIQSLLHTIGLHSAGIQSLQEKTLRTLASGKADVSLFYKNPIIVLYFITQSIPSSLHELAQKALTKHAHLATSRSAAPLIRTLFELSQLRTSSLYSCPTETIARIQVDLEKAEDTTPFFFELRQGTVDHYAHSHEFALATLIELKHLQASRMHHIELLEHIKKILPAPASQSDLLYLASRAQRLDTIHHLTALPVPHLRTATLAGWLAYALYDDVHDDHSSSHLRGTSGRLVIANYLLWFCASACATASPQSPTTLNEHFLAMSRSHFTLLDIKNARALRDAYPHKSDGALVPFAACVATLNVQPELTNIYHRILTIRQTLDDLADAYDDLHADHRTPTVIAMSKAGITKRTAKSKKGQAAFAQFCITEAKQLARLVARTEAEIAHITSKNSRGTLDASPLPTYLLIHTHEIADRIAWYLFAKS